jgi:uncharacterized protein YndB with AHSA1/START domain
MSFDLASHLGAVTRVVDARTRGGKPARALVATGCYATDVEDLWDALTNPERLPRWFLPVSGELRLGGRYQLQGNAGGTITGCEPPKRLDVTWEFGGGTSWVSVELSPVRAGTELRLEHVAHVDEHWGRFGPGAVGVGWELALGGLGLHLASGEPVRGGDDPAWIASPEYREFVRASSSGWGAAAIAAGDEPEAARAAAERTRAFYTGDADPG